MIKSEHEKEFVYLFDPHLFGYHNSFSGTKEETKG